MALRIPSGPRGLPWLQEPNSQEGEGKGATVMRPPQSQYKLESVNTAASRVESWCDVHF